MNRFRFIIFTFFSLVTAFSSINIVVAQSKADSLKNRVILTNDHAELLDLYSEIALNYYYSDQDSALSYYRKYLNVSIKLDDSVSIADALYWIADIHFYSNLDSSKYYCEKYQIAAERVKDTSWIAQGYDFLAYINYEEGEIDEALKNFQTALKYFLIVDDQYFIGAAYNNIGYTISYGIDQPASLTYFLKALKIAEEIRDTSLIADVSCNIAYYYDCINDLGSAYKFYQRSLDLDLTQGDSTSISSSYANLSYINSKLKKNKVALSQIQRAKEHISQYHTPYYLSELYTTLIDTYIELENTDSTQCYLYKLESILEQHNFPIQKAYLEQQKGFLYFLSEDYRKSISYLDKSIVIFKELNSLEPFALTYEKRAEAYAALGLFEEAYESQILANAITDSMKYGEVAGLLSKLEHDRFYQAEMEQNKLESYLASQTLENSKIRYTSNLKLALITILLLGVLVVIIILSLSSIRKKNRILEESELKLRELNATKDKFFSIIGHDLKNPFSAINGLSELYMEDPGQIASKDIFPIMEGIHKASNLGSSLLENLLDWARSQTGVMVPDPVKILIRNKIDEVVNEFNTIAGNKNITIEVNCLVSTTVYADENMVTTILRNLIHNAIKFSYMNSVITINTIEQDHFFVISVEDQGVGLSEDELKKLFSIDGQVKKAGTSREKGSGLGLILCKEFVEKNKGEIWVTCQEKKGCKFYFSLPLHVAN